MIDVLVPVKSEFAATKRQIAKFIGHPRVGSILVSVNQPGSEVSNFRTLETIAPNVRVWIQTTDLGLYGNFRFLLERASSDWCLFAAIDDDVSESLLASALLARETPPGLVVAMQQHVNVTRDDTLGSGSIVFLDQVGNVCDLDTMLNISARYSGLNILTAPPSWIFGIWETRYLRRIYPRRDFNWLDSYILSRALADRKVEFDMNAGTSLIGVWPDRLPNAVGKSWRRPFGWLVTSLSDSSIRAEAGVVGLFKDWRVVWFLFPKGLRRVAKSFRGSLARLGHILLARR